MTPASLPRSKLLPELAGEGIVIRDYADLNASQLQRAAKYFQETVFPVLTPLALRPRPALSRTFPT